MTAQNKSQLSGRCACGSVHYELITHPMFVHCCHCTDCQRETGSTFAINALIETSEVVVTQGKVDWMRLPSASGAGQVLATCGQCRTVLWSHYSAAKERVAFIRVGTLDKGHEIEPDIHIFTRSKVPWVELPPGETSVPVYYRRKEHWPESSLSRYEAVLRSPTDNVRFEMGLCNEVGD